MAENSLKHINPSQWAKEMAERTLDMDEAIRVLKEFPIRTLDEVLNKAIEQHAKEFKTTETAVKAVLRQNLGQQNMSNWLKPKNKKNISRELAIKIAFVLRMNPEDTENFLNRCWHDGFYMRDVKDVIYRHGLDREWDYEETEQMLKQMLDAFGDLDSPNIEPKFDANVQSNKLTKYLNEKYEKTVFTKKQLENFIKENKQYFGTFRRKPYGVFMMSYEYIKEDENLKIFLEADKRKITLNDLKEGRKRVIEGNESETFLTPNGFILDTESIPEEKLESLKKAVKWLLGPNALVLDNMSEEKICEIKKGISILLDPKNYTDNTEQKNQLNDLKKDIYRLLEQSIMSEKELKSITDGIDQLFGKKKYARDTISGKKLYEAIVMSIPYIRKNEKLSEPIRKKITEKVPARREAISEILNSVRNGVKQKVDRKILILVYLLAFNDPIKIENKEKAEAAYYNAVKIINLKLLEPCGMPFLDHRHPFDWIVFNSLYCAYFSDVEKEEVLLDAIERIGKVLKYLANGGNI